MVSLLGHSSDSESRFFHKMSEWSSRNQKNLSDYWVATGEITSTRRNSAGARYIQLASELTLIAPVSGFYRNTRIGFVLRALVGDMGTEPNPFFLSSFEKILFTYLILEKDADMFLCIIDYLGTVSNISLRKIQ